MIQLNKNILQLKPSATLAVNQKVKELRQKGETVYHFGFGQSPFPIHNTIVDELKDHAQNNHYFPSTGLPELKEEIASFLHNHQGLQFNTKSIFIGPGSKELLYQIIYLLKGIFLIPKASWVSYVPQIKSKNGKYEILDTFLEDDFKLKPATLQEFCEKHESEQKILILNSPNNPTGSVYTEKELKDLTQILRKHRTIVLSDEIYSQINFNNNFSPSIAQYYPEKTIVFGGLSKVFSAGGYRLGFSAIPSSMKNMYQPLQSFFSETFSAVSSPVQYAAIKAYQMNPDLQNYIKDCIAILKEISGYIYNALEKLNIECTRPQGAFYMMIGFENFKERINNNTGIKTSDELANYLLSNFRVALLPASDFYFKPKEFFFRLAFVDFNGEEVLEKYKSTKNIDPDFIEKYTPNIYNGIKAIKRFLAKI